MLQPVNALTPKVFRGRGENGAVSAKDLTQKRIAFANAAGVSVATGAVTSIIARSYTATWRNAACFGLGASLITMMFICPKMLYKLGIYTTSKQEKDSAQLAKKILKK